MARSAVSRAIEPKSLSDWTRTTLVLAAGGVGGLAYWIIQFSAGVLPLRMAWYLGIPASVVLGIVASGLGVYLIANSDTNELKHTLAFALLCGIFWKPVIDSAQGFLRSTTTAYDGSSLASSAESLSKGLANGSQGQVGQKVEEVSQNATQVVQQIANVSDGAVKEQVIGQSKKAVDAIGVASTKAPEQSVEGLRKIGVTAAQSGQPEVAKAALEKLRAIGAQNQPISPKAEEASQAIIFASQARLGVNGSKLTH